MKKKLNQYRGRLSAAQVAEGINAALQNARRLVADAKTLLSAGAYASAASLAILSVEESGKCSILRGIALARTDDEFTQGWKDYRSHIKKNVLWIMPELIASGARRIEDMRPAFDEASDHPELLDQLKQLGFYTDCLGSARWSKPGQVVDEQTARTLIQIAEVSAASSECSEREIELWREHLGPVWKQDMAQMKQALACWYEAMQEEGLKCAGVNLMNEFVRSEGPEASDTR